ncbi:MAG: ATP synthase F1 subunit gamma [Flavobacteriaceae bacterium CG_4_8_14_3_um_filter_34_10]|nr:ATP synthase F1 subunit gamma [Flavobacteriia bacterium]PIQ18872.1 MAG: ATP synthase F1 subunit gamma [Flavobacteriaceae bacterium CG18_big_fil_WC_8_21_14_2_50_34_36]PIX08204.1 MAG: ATP synthase F1 subunit gamma [Flavobacteriaceae bacterium CG_4_8_14_3_um_filter_34_10]PIZ07150.1 MAG: ATP synthase F1 subunit gamma [Flavobacteriaceae bacterium CG_4_10_14_0_8_um_filter_34_31]
MANLKEIRNRITSVSSTMQITSAMKMVSAAKLKKAQDAITAMRPYANKLTQLLQTLSASLDGDSGSKFAEEREVKSVLIVPVTSNRGLAGAFNTNIIKEAKHLAATEYAGKKVDFYTIGKKGNDILKKTHSVIQNNNAIFDALDFESVSVIAEKLMELFMEGKYDKIVLVYNQFKNAATQIVVKEQFLPIIPMQLAEESTVNQNSDYIFEPSKEEIVNQLIPKSLKTQLFTGIRDSVASEHGARMTAMHKATDNATELRDALKLSYNKARQASITNEILEIVGGAEALNN